MMEPRLQEDQRQPKQMALNRKQDLTLFKHLTVAHKWKLTRVTALCLHVPHSPDPFRPIPVGERADEGVDEQLDERFGGKQQTDPNVFLLQEQTVLQTGGVLRERREEDVSRKLRRITVASTPAYTYRRLSRLVGLQVGGLGIRAGFGLDLLQAEGGVVKQGHQRSEGGGRR